MNKLKTTAIVLFLIFAFSACNRSTCPTYDQKSGEQKSSKGGGKTKSGVYPKGMK